MSKSKKSYSELLQDPRWQKKRLEIFQRDKWECQRCGDKTSTLHIHHLEYVYGKKPWEYAKKDLETLCEKCHKKIHNAIKDVEEVREHFFAEGVIPLVIKRFRDAKPKTYTERKEVVKQIANFLSHEAYKCQNSKAKGDMLFLDILKSFEKEVFYFLRMCLNDKKWISFIEGNYG